MYYDKWWKNQNHNLDEEERVTLAGCPRRSQTLDQVIVQVPICSKINIIRKSFWGVSRRLLIIFSRSLHQSDPGKSVSIRSIVRSVIEFSNLLNRTVRVTLKNALWYIKVQPQLFCFFQNLVFQSFIADLKRFENLSQTQSKCLRARVWPFFMGFSKRIWRLKSVTIFLMAEIDVCSSIMSIILYFLSVWKKSW